MKTVILGILVVLILILLIQNIETLSLRFLIWQISLPQFAIVLASVLLGFSLGAIAFAFKKKK